MTTCVHYDKRAPKRERWRVLRAADGKDAANGRWITVESFGTERDAKAFAQGFCLGSQYTAPPESLESRENRSIELLRAARERLQA